MIPAVTLIPMLSSAARMLIGGSPPSKAEWNSEVTGLLEALLAQRDQMVANLNRIEQKIDGLMRQDFEHSFGTALNLLEEAAPAHRDLKERDRMLAAARDHLVRADVAADDPLAKATAECYLGLAWLLSRSKQDCDLAMRRAADHCFGALHHASGESSTTSFLEKGEAQLAAHEGVIERLTRRLSARREAEAAARKWAALGARLKESNAAFHEIREIRLALGTPPNECPQVSLWNGHRGIPARKGEPPADMLRGEIDLFVDAGPGEIVRIAGLDVGVPEIQIRTEFQVDGGVTYVDAEIVLGSWAGTPPTLELRGLDQRQVEWLELDDEATHRVSRPRGGRTKSDNRRGDRNWPSSMGPAPALPGPALFGDGINFPERGLIAIESGQVARGWVRFGIVGEPAAIILKTTELRTNLYFARALRTS
jgi:hypothetical protein